MLRPLRYLPLLVTPPLAACGDCGRDRPSTPFSGAGATSARPATSSSASAAGGFTEEEAKAPPGDGTSFPLSGGEARPRGGRLVRLALVLDADGDAVDDVVAWTEGSDGRKGELAFFRGSDPSAIEATLVALPKALELDHCARTTGLTRSAPGVIQVRVAAECAAPRRREQWVGVVRLDPARSKSAPRAPELRLELSAHAPLDVSLTARDRDGDGHDDLTVEARLRASPTAATAALVFLDRPAGYAVDPAEPEASLGRIGKELAAGAAAADLRARAGELLDLARAMCADLGTAALGSTAGAGTCGEARFVADAVYASALGELRAGDVARAVATAGLLGALKSDGGRRAALDQALEKRAARVEAAISVRAAARPAPQPAPLAPFAFVGGDDLLIATDKGVVKLDTRTGEEAPSDAIAWPRGLAWRSGDAVVDVLGADVVCEPPARRIRAKARQIEVHATAPGLFGRVPSGAFASPCAPGSAALSPLVADGSGATVAIGGEVFRLSFEDAGLVARPADVPPAGPEYSPPGAARSADGAAWVLPGPDGLLVGSGARVERWQGSDLRDLSACVARPEGDRVVCLSGRSVVVVTRR